MIFGFFIFFLLALVLIGVDLENRTVVAVILLIIALLLA